MTKNERDKLNNAIGNYLAKCKPEDDLILEVTSREFYLFWRHFQKKEKKNDR